VTRNLMPHAPPRDVKILSREQSIDQLEILLTHLLKFGKLLELTTLEELIHFFQTLSALQSNIVARSHLAVLVHSHENFLGKGELSQLITKSLHSFVQLQNIIPRPAITRSLYRYSSSLLY